jgi:hypothetical protein
MKESVGARLFALEDGIRSVMVVDQKGIVKDWVSRTKRLVSKEFVDGLARAWVGVMGGLVGTLDKFFGKDEFLHIRYEKLHLYGFRHGDNYVILSARPDHPPDLVQNVISELALG